MSDKEVWLPIPGFEGDYEASSLGRFRRMTFRNGKSERIYEVPRMLKLTEQKTGYLTVTLSDQRRSKQYLAHRMVLLAFRGDGRGYESSHLNGDRKDNRIENLAWETCRVNACRRWDHGTMLYGEHLPYSKLTDKTVAEIRSLYENGVRRFQLAKQFNVHERTIGKVLKRQTWKHVA